MGGFNSEDHYIYYCRQESLRRNGVAIIVNKRVWTAVLGCSVKNDRMISVHFWGKAFNIMVILVYTLTSNAEEVSSTVLWRPTGSSRISIQRRCPFHYRGLECICRNSRNTWSNRQIWPWSTEWSRAKANRVLPRECTGHSKHPLLTAQKKTLQVDITRWSTAKSDWFQLIIFFAGKDGEALYSQQKQDWELTVAQILIAKFRLKLKKVGKTTRPFKFD